MRYSEEYLKGQLDSQNITYTDEDIQLVQKIMNFIDEGEEKLNKFEDVQSTNIFLRNDMEAMSHEE